MGPNLQATYGFSASTINRISNSLASFTLSLPNGKMSRIRSFHRLWLSPLPAAGPAATRGSHYHETCRTIRDRNQNGIKRSEAKSSDQGQGVLQIAGQEA